MVVKKVVYAAYTEVHTTAMQLLALLLLVALFQAPHQLLAPAPTSNFEFP